MISYEIPSHVSGDTWYGIPCITIIRNNSALDLTDAYINMQVKLSIDSPIVLDLSTDNGAITILSPASSGKLQILPQIIDIPVATYKYELHIILNNTEKKTEMNGIWKILPQIPI